MLWLCQGQMGLVPQIYKYIIFQSDPLLFNLVLFAGILKYGFKEVRIRNSKIFLFKIQMMPITSFGKNIEEKFSGI